MSGIIDVSEADLADPVRMGALRRQAVREGKMLAHPPKKSFHGQRIADALASREAAVGAGLMHTVKASDSTAVMRNLAAIAKGKVVVTE